MDPSKQSSVRAPARRWLPAVLLVIFFPLAAVHFSCVAVLGPGSWGSGVEEKTPELLPAGGNPELLQYIDEFSAPAPERPGWDGDLSGLEGTVVFADRLEDEDGLDDALDQDATGDQHDTDLEGSGDPHDISDLGGYDGSAGDDDLGHNEDLGRNDDLGHNEPWVVQTARAGGNWTQGQRLYLRAPGGGRFRELDIARDMIVDRPTLLRKGSSVVLVFGRWNSWAISALDKISRYLRSYLDSSLLPEYSLYVHDISEGTTRYQGPGGTLKESPDRRKAAFLRSGSRGTSLHSIHIWNLETGKTETVISLTEADPGSGTSFDYRWSGDSRALHISGGAGGFVARSAEPRQLNLIYVLAEKALYSIE